MVKAKIVINNCGTIGKRVADAVRAQDNMEVIGVFKTKANCEASVAPKFGYEINGFLFEAEISDQLIILIIGLVLSNVFH